MDSKELHVERVETLSARDKDAELARYATADTTVLEQSYTTSFKTWVVIVLLSFAWSSCTLANIGPGSTSSYVAKSLNGTALSSWIPNAGLFPLIGLQPLWGSLGDRFGKKWFMVVGGTLGFIGNIVAARSDSIYQVIVGQAITGTGCSLLLLAIPTLMEIVPAQTRPYAQGFAGVLNGTLAIIGLIESGGFAQMSAQGWRWVYYFNAIFFGIASILIAVIFNPPPTKLRRENTVKDELKSVDIVGATLLVGGVIGIILALTWGGNTYAWSSSHVIAFLVVGIVLLIAFGLYETLGRSDGIIDHRFLESRNFFLILSVAFVDGMLLYGVNAFFPVEAQAIFTSNLLKVNLYLLPLNILVLVGCLGSGVFLGRLRHYRSLLVGSLVTIGLFLGLLTLVTPSRVVMACIFTGFVGLCTGVTTVLPVVIMSYSVPSHLIGTAETVLASCRALGGTIGIAIFATVYGDAMKSHLPSGVAKAAIAAGLPPASAQQFVGALLGGVGSITAVAGVTPSVIKAAVAATADISAQSFENVWFVNMAAALASALLCCFLRPVADMMTRHVESALEDGQLRAKQMEYVKN